MLTRIKKAKDKKRISLLKSKLIKPGKETKIDRIKYNFKCVSYYSRLS